MSISSEISRISGNVSAALTAIGNKGVTVPQGSTSDDLATLIGSIQTGGDSSIKYKTGSFTPTQNYDSNTSVKIVDISDIGFTPTRFYFWVDKISDLSQTQYAITRTSYENLGSTPMHVRLTVRYTNATGTVGVALNSSSWTTRTNGWLYANETSIYFRASSAYTLLANVKYNWMAEA